MTSSTLYVGYDPEASCAFVGLDSRLPDSAFESFVEGLPKRFQPEPLSFDDSTEIMYFDVTDPATALRLASGAKQTLEKIGCEVELEPEIIDIDIAKEKENDSLVTIWQKQQAETDETASS